MREYSAAIADAAVALLPGDGANIVTLAGMPGDAHEGIIFNGCKMALSLNFLRLYPKCRITIYSMLIFQSKVNV